MIYIIEIATSDFNTTKSAVEGGADRIELCANLAEGGRLEDPAGFVKRLNRLLLELSS